MTLNTADVDLDFADRTQILGIINHVAARGRHGTKNQVAKHNSGVYVTDIPYVPINECAAIDYKTAEERGYFKIDFLNVYVYSLIKDTEHYQWLLEQFTPWEQLNNKEFAEQIIHIGNHYESMQRMPEPINSIERMAMFLAIIRPGKRELLSKEWKTVAQTVWNPTDEGYTFKKSHAIAYSHLVSLHMKLVYFSNESD